MHRKVIDHPAYIPEEARAGLDWESGKSDGRIYRIVRKDFKEEKYDRNSGLSSKSSIERIISYISSAEEWERATAHRLLLERNDMASVPSLKKIAINAVYPESRARVLWLLNSLNSLNANLIKTAMLDKVSGVREQAVLLAGACIEKYPELVQSLVSASNDEAMRVRFNSALVLGSLEGPGVVKALAKIAARDGKDQWVRAAVLSGIEKRMPIFLSSLREQQGADPMAYAAVMKDLSRLFGNAGTVADCRILLQEVLSANGDDEWRVSAILGLAEGTNGRTKEFGTSPKGMLFALQGTNSSPANVQSLDNFINKSIVLAENGSGRTQLRVLATALLGYTDFDRASNTLQKMLDPRTPPELLLEAVSAITRLNDPRGAALLTAKQAWSAYTPRVKSAVISALVSKPIFISELFVAIENGTITSAEISSADRIRLMSNKDQKLSEQAKLLFKELEGGDRMQIYQEYRKSLALASNVQLGKAVFQKSCSACHTYQKEGGKVGPDLTGVKNQPAEALLLHILVPNYEVLPAYQSISVSTNDGRSLSGWLVSETENSMTLRTTFGTDEAILRKNIVALSNSGLSLMPDGLERSVSKDEMAKLIAYLKGGS